MLSWWYEFLNEKSRFQAIFGVDRYPQNWSETIYTLGVFYSLNYRIGTWIFSEFFVNQNSSKNLNSFFDHILLARIFWCDFTTAGASPWRSKETSSEFVIIGKPTEFAANSTQEVGLCDQYPVSFIHFFFLTTLGYLCRRLYIEEMHRPRVLKLRVIRVGAERVRNLTQPGTRPGDLGKSDL